MIYGKVNALVCLLLGLLLTLGETTALAGAPRPSTPASVTLPSTDTDGSYRLSWGSTYGGDRYEITGSGSYSTGNTYIDFSGMADGTYTYRVRACTDNWRGFAEECGYYSYSVSVTVRRVPGYPGVISMPATSTGSYSISWGASSGYVDYYHYREAYNSGGWSSWVNHGVSQSKSFSGRSDGSYYYQVQACNSIGGCGGVRTSAVVTVTNTPSVPGSLSVPSAANSNYTVSWGDANGTVESYKLERKGSSGNWSQIYSGLAQSQSESLGNGSYQYRVQACNTAGCSDWRTSVYVDVTLPSTLTLSTSISQDGSYTLSGEVNEIFGNAVWYERINAGLWNAIIVSGSAKNFTAKPEGTYEYYVQEKDCRPTQNGCVNLSTVGPVSVIVDYPAPSIPGSFTLPASSETGEYTVSWSASTGDVDFYILQRALNGGAWEMVYTGGATVYAETESDGSYTYQVQACSTEGGCSNWSTSGAVSVQLMSISVSHSATGSYELAWHYNGPSELFENIDGGTWEVVASNTDAKSFFGKSDGTYGYYVQKWASGPNGMEQVGTLGPVYVTVTVPAPILIASETSSSDGSFTLSWSQVVGLGYASIRRVDYSSSVYTTENIKVLDSASGSMGINVENSGTYRYYIQDQFCSNNDCVLGKQSNTVTVAVDIPGVPMQVDGNVQIAPPDIMGVLPYNANVNAQGEANIRIGLEMLPGVNNFSPELAIEYNSNRIRKLIDEGKNEDVIGSGWKLTGLSEMRPCYKAVPDEGVDHYGDFTLSRICLDGQPLSRITPPPPDGHNVNDYYGDGLEFVLWNDNGIKIRRYGYNSDPAKNDMYFKVYRPDGTVAEYGGTPDSEMEIEDVGGNKSIWRINKLTDAFGNTITYEYHEDEKYKFAVPTKITYGNAGDAVIEFDYQWRKEPNPNIPPPDFSQIGFPVPGGDYTSYQGWYENEYTKRPLTMSKITLTLDGLPVREYRLNSQELSDQWTRLRQIQLCGYDKAGTNATCILPLTVDWDVDPDDKLKARVAGVGNGQGKRTEFTYTTMTQNGSEANFSEEPFGALPSVLPQYTLQIDPDEGSNELRTVVTQVRHSDGIGGMRRYNHTYQGRGLRSDKGWGFMGFYAQKIEDVAAGIYTYRQFNFDHHFLGINLSAEMITLGVYDASSTHYLSKTVAVFDALPIHHTEFKHKWYMQWLVNPGRSSYRYIKEKIKYQYEDGQLLGVTVMRNHPEFTATTYDRYIGGANGPYQTEQVWEYPQLKQTSTQLWAKSTDSLLSNSWGLYQSPQLQDVARAVETISTVEENRDTEHYLIAFPVSTIKNYYTGDVNASVESSNTQTIRPYVNQFGSKVPLIESITKYESDAAVELTQSYTYQTAGHKTSVTVSGANLPSRTTAFSNFIDGRYSGTLTNAAGHVFLNDYDPRFGVRERITDPNNRISMLALDALGREIYQTTADNVNITTLYDSCTFATCQMVGSVSPVAVVTVSSPISPDSKTYIDSLGRVVRKSTIGFDGVTEIYQDVHYNVLGRVEKSSLPYYSGTTPAYEQYQYDAIGRIIRVDKPNGTVILTHYSIDTTEGDVVTTITEQVKDAQGNPLPDQVRKLLTNYIGEISESTDAVGTLDEINTKFSYYATGLTKEVRVDDSLVASMTFNAAGTRTLLTDVNVGAVTTVYNGLGELREQTDHAGNTIEYVYDALGRKTQEISADGIGKWVYDPATALGMLDYSEFADARTDYYHKLDMNYDSNYKLQQIDTQIEVPDFTGSQSRAYAQSFTYDQYGRLETTSYPSGVTIQQHYTAKGYVEKVTDSAENVLQSIVNVDAFGHITEETFGTDISTARHYDPYTGYLLDLETTSNSMSVQDNHYQWRSNGILQSRENNVGVTKVEAFDYDNLNRLTDGVTAINGIQQRTITTDYARNGNILNKTDDQPNGDQVIGYQYGTTINAGPNAVSLASLNGIQQTLHYNLNGAITHYDAASGDDKYIDWTARGKPWRITKGVSVDTATPTARDEIAYGVNGARYYKKSTWLDNNAAFKTEHTFYIGSYEDVYTDSDADYGRIEKVRLGEKMMHFRGNRISGGTDDWYEVLHLDYLGSVEAVTDLTGQVLMSLAYEPFGSRREADWSAQLTGVSLDELLEKRDTHTSRGYTGHEHLDRTGLIHMNGRVYDPILGRFLSADPLVQAPYNSQSYNRYSYAFNNPLLYTDPSGYGSQIESDRTLSELRVPAMHGFPWIDGCGVGCNVAYLAPEMMSGFLDSVYGGGNWFYGSSNAINSQNFEWGYNEAGMEEMVVTAAGDDAGTAATVTESSSTFDSRMQSMVKAGHAGIGHKLTWNEAKWLWKNGNGTTMKVDGRVLSTIRIGSDSYMVVPFPLDDLKVHGKVSVAANGRIYDAPFDFLPVKQSNPYFNPIITIRNILNSQAIKEVGPGKAFEIEYRYEDRYFEN